MNIKNKANLHFKLFPVIYEENQYACTISAAKSYLSSGPTNEEPDKHGARRTQNGGR